MKDLSVCEDFSFHTEKLYREHINIFSSQTAELLGFDESQEWLDHVTMHEEDLASSLRTMINHSREKEMGKLQMLTLQMAKDSLEPIINGPVYTLNHTFWDEIMVPYDSELHDIAEHCHHILNGK